MRSLPAEAPLQRGLSVMLIAALLGGCATTRQAQISPLPSSSGSSLAGSGALPLATVTGVTTTDGETIRFDRPGFVRAGSVYGTVKGIPYQIRRSEVHFLRVDAPPRWTLKSGKIVGIEALATLAGETVEFDKPGAEVQGEIVSGIVNGIPYQIPTAQVEQLWLKGKNKGGITIPLLVIAAVAVMGAVSLSQNDLISFGSWECFGC